MAPVGGLNDFYYRVQRDEKSRDSEHWRQESRAPKAKGVVLRELSDEVARPDASAALVL